MDGEKADNRLPRKVAVLAAGLTANKLLEMAFDYALYPFVIYRLGIIKGGVVMLLLSYLACLLIIRLYDWSRRDWLGIETIKNLRGYAGDKRIGRLTSWVLQKSEAAIFVFLSIKFDAFITMIYFRQGAFNGMTTRDWRIFNGSLLFSNAYWTLACYLGVSVFEYAFGTIGSVQ